MNEKKTAGTFSRPSLFDRILWPVGVFALFFGGYGLANRLIPISACWDGSTWLDRSTPFWPEFVYPFYLTYLLIPMPALLLSDRRALYRAGLAFGLLIVCSCATFALLPVYVPRPEVNLDSFSTRLVAEIYAYDRPVCGFPSLHVSTAFLAALILLKEHRSLGWLFIVFAILASFSTLFIKQHVVIDVIGGTAMAAMVDILVMTGFAGNLVRGLRAGVFLLRNMNERPSGDQNARLRESRQRTGTGTEYDLYEPVRAATRTVIAVSGLTLMGERDHRFVNFCRALAESGVRVAAPALPALKTCRFEESDLDIIIALIRELHQQEGTGISLIGFSIGGGLALAAVASAEARDVVDLVVVFGAHYDLGPLWQEVVRKHQGGPPTDDLDWEDYIWLRMIMAYRRLSSLDLREAEREEMIGVLASYCDLPIETKKQYFERVMKPRRELTELAGFDDAAVLARMSPLGRLLELKAAVMVFHDPHDLLVPAGEARRLYEELKLRGPDARQRLLITPLLSHVISRSTWHLMDLFPLLGMMGELFRRQARGKDD